MIRYACGRSQCSAPAEPSSISLNVPSDKVLRGFVARGAPKWADLDRKVQTDDARGLFGSHTGRRRAESNRMPCAITLLPVPKTSMSFYDFDEYERLVAAASAIDATAHLIVLLDGEAGLPCGEMIAREWKDVDLSKRQLCIQRSDWNGQVTTPKGGRLR
jgi:integrase